MVISGTEIGGTYHKEWIVQTYKTCKAQLDASEQLDVARFTAVIIASWQSLIWLETMAC